ncbi:MAG: mandelate racemase/muconate lactonizing enzyme family protein, partial [Planctomycetaceae bacterium]|nr:mandelate racemase/muconate lactonizing enzyme family protein [Planctomycetaceae bacterium]
MKISAVKPVIVGDQRNFFFVVVETDEGLRGVGEGGITWREQAMGGFVEALR